jgi:hypothetical protein
VPAFQRMLERANHRFASDRIAEINPEILMIDGALDGNVLVTPASTLEIARTDAEREIVRRCPLSIQVAVLSITYAAVLRSRSAAPVPVTFAWVSGYDFELSVFEARPGRDSWGGVTLVLKTPYPD